MTKFEFGFEILRKIMNQFSNCKNEVFHKNLFFKISKILPKTFNLVWRKNKNKKLAKSTKIYIYIYGLALTNFLKY